MHTTTSLTVEPVSFLIAFTRSSESWPKANRRWPEMRPLKDVFGGRAPVDSRICGSLGSTPSRRRTRVSPRASVGPPGNAVAPGSSGRCGSAVGAERSAFSGWSGSESRPRPSIPSSPGARSGLRSPAGGGISRPSGEGSSSTREDLVARHAVDHGVVDLGQHRRPALGEALDQVQLPQRPVAIERAREDPRDGLGELAVRRRRRDGRLADVEVEVEVRVLDPVRVREPERHVHELPAERRQQVQPVGDEAADVLHAEVAAGRGGGVVDREAAHVPVRARGLHGQELRVKARQLPHRVSSSSRI